MAVLVTGANGFIGSPVCQGLADRGYGVVAMYHRHRQRLDETGPRQRLHVERGDLLDTGSLRRILAAYRIEAICHLAVEPPPAGVCDEAETRRINTTGTRNLLICAADAGIERIVFTSSMSVYDFLNPQYLPVDEEHPLDPKEVYGQEKLAAERICEGVGEARLLKIVILRLAGVFGRGKPQGAVYNFTKRAFRGEAIRIAQNRSVDLLHVDDAATAVATALDRIDEIIDTPGGTRVYNVGSGGPASLAEIAQCACAATGRTVGIHVDSSGSSFYMDIQAAKRDLSYRPEPLATGVAAIAAWIAETEVVDGDS
jgi:UDP-glucose 4-epimerase